MGRRQTDANRLHAAGAAADLKAEIACAGRSRARALKCIKMHMHDLCAAIAVGSDAVSKSEPDDEPVTEAKG